MYPVLLDPISKLFMYITYMPYILLAVCTSWMLSFFLLKTVHKNLIYHIECQANLTKIFTGAQAGFNQTKNVPPSFYHKADKNHHNAMKIGPKCFMNIRLRWKQTKNSCSFARRRTTRSNVKQPLSNAFVRRGTPGSIRCRKKRRAAWHSMC